MTPCGRLPPVSVLSPRFHRTLAPFLLTLALASAVGPYLGHHEHEGPAFGGELRPGALYSAGALHPNAPAHLEGTSPVEVRACEVCLLRAQTRDGDLSDAASISLGADRSRGPAAADPRIASLAAAGPPGSRGPPSLPVVS